VEAVYAAVDRLTPDDVLNTPVPSRDLEERTVLLADLERTADRWGRGTLLDEGRDATRRALSTRMVSRFRAESGAVGIVTGGRADDFAQLVLAIEDAIAVAATEDLLDAGDAATLADPGRRILGLEPLAASDIGPVPGASGWEPSAEDWAAADGGRAAVDREEPMSGGRTLQATFFAIGGAFFAVCALAAGVANDQPLLGAAGAGAVALLAFTFATYRRPVNRP
jgi:hypothetical protein